MYNIYIFSWQVTHEKIFIITKAPQKPFNEFPELPPGILTTRMKISRITAVKYLKQLQGIGVLKAKQFWKETLYSNTKLFDLLKSVAAPAR